MRASLAGKIGRCFLSCRLFDCQVVTYTVSSLQEERAPNTSKLSLRQNGNLVSKNVCLVLSSEQEENELRNTILSVNTSFIFHLQESA
jgi:hypothetical protein